MSKSYVPNEIHQAVNTFRSQNRTCDIQVLKQCAQKNFPDPDERRCILQAVFERAGKQADLASAVDRMWPKRKGY